MIKKPPGVVTPTQILRYLTLDGDERDNYVKRHSLTLTENGALQELKKYPRLCLALGYVRGKLSSDLESCIASDPNLIYLYARSVLGYRWLEQENNLILFSNLSMFSLYVQKFIKGRWVSKETIILKSNKFKRYVKILESEEGPLKT